MASYRSLTATYYPEYAASAHAAAGYIGNGYFDVASPRSALTSIPYDAASQFNRYFDPDKVDCKYNPNSESPKTEFQGSTPGGQPPQPQGHPNSGKQPQESAAAGGAVKTEPSFVAAVHQDDQVVVELQQFVATASAAAASTATSMASSLPTTTTAQIILVRFRPRDRSFCGSLTSSLFAPGRCKIHPSLPKKHLLYSLLTFDFVCKTRFKTERLSLDKRF